MYFRPQTQNGIVVQVATQQKRCLSDADTVCRTVRGNVMLAKNFTNNRE